MMEADHHHTGDDALGRPRDIPLNPANPRNAESEALLTGEIPAYPRSARKAP